MQIECPQCGAAISAADVDLGLRVGKCQTCDQIVPVADQLERIADTHAGSPHSFTNTSGNSPDHPLVPQPASLLIEETGDSLEIRKRWFHPAVLFLVFFCLIWDGFLVVWYSIVLGFGVANGPPGLIGLFFAVFPLGHVAIGVGLTYFCIASFLNTTTMIVREGSLSLRHGPLYWPGNLTLATDDIEQLYVKSILGRHSTRHGDYSHPGRISVAGRLMAVMSDNKEQVVWNSESDLAVLRCIEQRVELFLGIEPHAVAGEAG
jgi:hypothetical protein